MTLENTLHVSDLEAGALGSYLLSRYKQPFLEVVSLELDGSVDPDNQWPVIFRSEIGTVITVRRRPAGGGALIEQVSTIQGITMGYDAEANDWQVGWWQNAADTNAYWVLGDAVKGVLGTTTRLFY